MTSIDQQRLRNDALYYKTYDTAGNKVTWESVKQDVIVRAKKYLADEKPKREIRHTIFHDMSEKCIHGAIPSGDVELLELLKSDTTSLEKYDLLADVRRIVVQYLRDILNDDMSKIVDKYEESKK